MIHRSRLIALMLVVACGSAKPAPQPSIRPTGRRFEESPRPASCAAPQGEDAKTFAALTANPWCASTPAPPNVNGGKGTVKARITLEADGHISAETDFDHGGGDIEKVSKLNLCWKQVPSGIEMIEGGKAEAIPATVTDGKLQVAQAAYVSCP